MRIVYTLHSSALGLREYCTYTLQHRIGHFMWRFVVKFRRDFNIRYTQHICIQLPYAYLRTAFITRLSFNLRSCLSTFEHYRCILYYIYSKAQRRRRSAHDTHRNEIITLCIHRQITQHNGVFLCLFEPPNHQETALCANSCQNKTYASVTQRIEDRRSHKIVLKRSHEIPDKQSARC